MIKFLKTFLIFVVLYHLFVTIIGYGVLGGAYPQLPALGRDVLWVFFFVIITLFNIKNIKTYLSTWKRPWILFIIILLFSTGISLFKGKVIYDIFVGIKYGLLYLFIFLSATFIGRIHSMFENGKMKIEKFLKFLKYLLIITLLSGFLRQGLKFIRPDFFFTIGYGPLNDFKFGVKPPIYYLTGYQGTPRRQGLFSGPNNYGYFLIAFLPVIIIFCRQKFTSIKAFFSANKTAILNSILIVLWIAAIALTLSRTAFIGGIVGLTFINIKRIRTHKKLSVGILVLLLAGLVGLSILKGASTINHIKTKFGSLQYVIQQPSGYGLGTSGPAILHNGTILPENYYIQLMLDIGTIGFLIRTIIILNIMQIARKIQKNIKTLKTNNQMIDMIRQGLNIGRISLLIMGIFLHIFEDSMINYLFFISRGILSGYLSTYITKK